MLAQLRLGFSDLNAHLYVKGCINSPICNCGTSAETINHYFLVCLNYSNNRQILLNSVSKTTPLPITSHLFHQQIDFSSFLAYFVVVHQ